jgi:hypothetical protein
LSSRRHEITPLDIHQHSTHASTRDFTQFNVVRLDRVLLKQVQLHSPQLLLLLLLLPPPTVPLLLIILLNVAAGGAAAAVIRSFHAPPHAPAVLI